MSAAVSSATWSELREPLLRTCRAHTARERASLVARLEGTLDSGIAVAREHARAMEGLLATVFAAACASVTPACVPQLALVATGGLGRRELGLFSDLDVIVLADDPRADDVVEVAERFFHALWDLGLDVGHAVRGVEDAILLAASDVRTATMLLDLRRIAGDPAIALDLERAFRGALPAIAPLALAELRAEREARHARFGDSPFLLEPEVKLGVGGLRDLDVARWSMGLGFGVLALDLAVERGLLLAHEAEELDAARAFAWDVRQRLHARAGRRQDRLTFEDQEEIARAIGEHNSEDELGVERFMQRHYRHARVAEQASERALARTASVGATTSSAGATPASEALGPALVHDPDVVVHEGRLALRPEILAGVGLRADPLLPLRFYRLVESEAIPPDPAAREAIARAMSQEPARLALRAHRGAAEFFLEMLAWIGEVPLKRGSILGELHDVGILLAMIPEFEPVTGRVQHDVYHVYTVDVHSIAAVDRLRALLRGELAEELPVATRVATEVLDKKRLALAVLLHDVGKGRGKDHSIHGAELAVPICARLGLAEHDAEHVRWLVLEHLHLYHWATRRDTSDPDTLAEIARAIGSAERLRDLYLLTLVDLATTNPKALTPWKARLFDDLYLELARNLEGESVPREATALTTELERRGAEAALALLATLPDRYAVGVDADTVVAHAEIVEARSARAVHVAERHGDVPELAELVVVADDRPGLLADIAAVLAAQRLTITSASIHTRLRPDGAAEVLDVFVVRSSSPGAEGPPVGATKLAGIRRDLERVVAGELDAHALLASRPAPPSWARRRRPAVHTEVVVDNAASPHFTVLDVFTRDREGLLHAIAHALHEAGVSIVLAKVSTEGERVADAFYVSEADGRKIEGASRIAELRESIRRAVERVEASA
ncbi:MAG: [protein-PII] uridylyltransferase [Sandaracinus sp.]